jgi:hypothetical protein
MSDRAASAAFWLDEGDRTNKKHDWYAAYLRASKQSGQSSVEATTPRWTEEELRAAEARSAAAAQRQREAELAKEVVDPLAIHESLHDQWRSMGVRCFETCVDGYDYEDETLEGKRPNTKSRSAEHCFIARLLAGKIAYFDLTPDCDMAGIYTRCFYRLVGSLNIYEVWPLDDPSVAWMYHEGRSMRVYQTKDRATWVYIKTNYERVLNSRHSPQLAFRLKSEVSRGGIDDAKLVPYYRTSAQPGTLLDAMAVRAKPATYSTGPVRAGQNVPEVWYYGCQCGHPNCDDDLYALNHRGRKVSVERLDVDHTWQLGGPVPWKIDTDIEITWDEWRYEPQVLTKSQIKRRRRKAKALSAKQAAKQ